MSPAAKRKEGASPGAKKTAKKVKKEEPVIKGEVKPVSFPNGRDGWKLLENTLLFKNFGVDQEDAREKVAAFDLDGTVIKTRSGRPFAAKPDDWQQFNKDVFKKMQAYHDEGYRIAIFSNQGGVGKNVTGKAGQNLMTKIDMVDAHRANPKAQKGQYPFPFVAFFAIGKGSPYRKPDPSMFKYFTKTFNKGKCDLSQSFFCGDMAGREDDPGKSNTDREFAANCQLPFKTPEEIFGEGHGKKAVPKRGEGEENVNKELCEALLELADLLKEANNVFKSRAFVKAAACLSDCSFKVTTKKEAVKLPGIGKSIGEKIEEFATTGKIAVIEELKESKDEIKKKAKQEAEEKAEGAAFAFID
jgi:bifunctional polynucleotide phosphatase/kinase